MKQRARVHAGATGIGSLPIELALRGRAVDPRETARIVADAFPELPHIVELPGRGAGADMVGRTAAMLAAVSSDFAVQTVPTGWRRTSRPGVDVERARRWLDEDFDCLAEVYAEYHGPFKLQICGPLTWCRVVEDSSGEPALRDSGFLADVVAAIGEVAHAQIARLWRLVPGVTDVVVQIDEPALPQVMNGDVPTASGRGRIAPPDGQRVRDWFSQLVRAVHVADTMSIPAPSRASHVWLHSCADASHLAMAHSTGFDGVSADVMTITRAALDNLVTAIDANIAVVLGVVNTQDWHQPTAALADVARNRIQRLQSALAVSLDEFADICTLTPSCGLAGASASSARAVMDCLHAIATSVSGGTMTGGRLD